MSLTAALGAAVSALNSQSAALSMIATNLANSSTTGYKSINASFASLLSGGTSAASSGTGGVSVSSKQNVQAQGLLTTSSTSTNMAISGSGFFVVSSGSDSSNLAYTRNGEFSVDDEGYLTNGGYYLMGWPTNADGTVSGTASSTTLEAIDTDAISTIAAATTTMSLSANLPAEAAIGDTFTSSLEVFDSLGTAGAIEVTWTKTAENTWSATFADPTMASDTSTAIGTVTSDPVEITFNSNGTLASTNPSPPLITIEGWTTGAANSSVSVNLGTAGSGTGLSQYTSGATTLSVAVESSQDGVAFGSLTSIAITEDGMVNAIYDNGMTRAIYKIPLATFTNADGLQVSDGGIYLATTKSGTATLRTAGEGGAGTIFGSQLEVSTTDTNTEFSRMMAAQQAYSGAAQVMSAANSMFETLISAVR